MEGLLGSVGGIFSEIANEMKAIPEPELPVEPVQPPILQEPVPNIVENYRPPAPSRFPIRRPPLPQTCFIEPQSTAPPVQIPPPIRPSFRPIAPPQVRFRPPSNS